MGHPSRNKRLSIHIKTTATTMDVASNSFGRLPACVLDRDEIFENWRMNLCKGRFFYIPEYCSPHCFILFLSLCGRLGFVHILRGRLRYTGLFGISLQNFHLAVRYFWGLGDSVRFPKLSSRDVATCLSSLLLKGRAVSTYDFRIRVEIYCSINNVRSHSYSPPACPQAWSPTLG